MPDLYFAAHWLPRAARGQAYTVACVAAQLADIIAHRDDPPEPIEHKRAVCSAVLDHLYRGQSTGKAELDGFASIASAAGLERRWFESFCDGLAKLEATKRYATWGRLCADLELAGGAAARIAARLLGADDILLERPTTSRQLAAWGAAVHLAGLLAGLGAELKHGHLRIPLDDLVRFELSEQALTRLVETGADEAFAALMRQQTARARNLLRGGSRWIDTIASARHRRAAWACTALHEGLLDRIDAGGGSVLVGRIGHTAWWRWRSMWRVALSAR